MGGMSSLFFASETKAIMRKEVSIMVAAAWLLNKLVDLVAIIAVIELFKFVTSGMRQLRKCALRKAKRVGKENNKHKNLPEPEEDGE